MNRLYGKYKKHLGVICLTIGCLILVVVYASSAPRGFPRGEVVSIEKGDTVGKVAEKLKQLGIIRSAFFYKAYVVLLHDGLGVQVGDYLFAEPQSALRVAFRTAFGREGMERIKVTIPEGSSSKEIASILKKSIPDFDTESFMILAKEAEGFLYPETYFFSERVKPADVIKTMRDVFSEKTADLRMQAQTSQKSFEDVVTMASILEEEENNDEDRQIISGILWKRIEKNMALQVDAPFYYLYGKGSSQLTTKDLAEKSPYNTYVNKGLPPGPISNPSVSSIRAALEPVSTKYWFYLSDKLGNTHYAATHDAHVENKNKYLR